MDSRALDDSEPLATATFGWQSLPFCFSFKTHQIGDEASSIERHVNTSPLKA